MRIVYLGQPREGVDEEVGLSTYIGKMLYGESRIPRLIDHAATLYVLVTREELVPFAHEALGVELFDLDRDQTARYPDITSVSVGSDYARSDEVEYDEQIDVERGSDSDQQIDAIDVALGDVRPARSDIKLEMLRDLDFVLRRYDVELDNENATTPTAGMARAQGTFSAINMNASPLPLVRRPDLFAESAGDG